MARRYPTCEPLAGGQASSALGRVRLGAASERDLEGEGYLFDGYLVADDVLLVGQGASDHFGLLLGRHGIEGVLERLNGAYRYVVRKDGMLWFGIDHFGGAALFYQLGSELNLFDDPSAHLREPTFNDGAVCCLLASAFTIDDETIYDGVRECSSGVLYGFDLTSGALRQRPWFKFNLRPEQDCEPEDLEAALLRCLPRLASAEGTYLLPLSGGLDSRTILALALRRGLPLEALTYGLPGASDYSIAGRLCAELGIGHTARPKEADGEAWFEAADMREMVRAMHLGRSLPEESDWRPMRRLASGPFVVCPGHGGDWLTGSFIDARLLRIRTLERLVEYILDFHCSLTPMSSGDFGELLRDKIRNSLLSIIPDCGEDPLACAERWNLEHRQRKYIANSAKKYRYLGMDAYLPLFDRDLMTLFMHLKTRHRIHQRAYVDLLRTRLYTGRLEALRRIENNRWNLDVDPPVGMGRPSLRSLLHQRLRELDRRKYRKRFRVSSMEGYDDAAAMLSSRDKDSFLRQKVNEAFPLLHPCVEQLRGLGCAESARHVSWTLRQQVSQMNPVGLFVCAFLPYLLEVD